jgi:N-acetylmuramoyl-L-alanine amidase
MITCTTKSLIHPILANVGTVKVLKNLNFRNQSPSTSAKIVSLAPENTSLNYVGWVINGQPINGNRKWYKDINGNYFWNGATV